jgi:hypothetical protein
VDGAEASLRLRGETRRVSGRVAARRCLRLAAAVVLCIDILELPFSRRCRLLAELPFPRGVVLVARAREVENETGDRLIWD